MWKEFLISSWFCPGGYGCKALHVHMRSVSVQHRNSQWVLYNCVSLLELCFLCGNEFTSPMLLTCVGSLQFWNLEDPSESGNFQQSLPSCSFPSQRAGQGAQSFPFGHTAAQGRIKSTLFQSPSFTLLTPDLPWGSWAELVCYNCLLFTINGCGLLGIRNKHF